MPELIVQHPTIRDVLVDGVASGTTNRPIDVAAGTHRVGLDGDPDTGAVDVELAADDAVTYVSIAASPPVIDRYSPIYCRYHGLLLGQFLMVAAASFAKPEWHIHRYRMQQFFDEVGLDVTLDEEQVEFGTPAHDELLQRVVVGLAAFSTDLVEFALLGVQLVVYGHMADTDPESAALAREEIERLVESHGLPSPDLDSFVAEQDSSGTFLIDSVLSPALRYLAGVIEATADEPDTAFVIMSFSPPYSDRFAEFYRPTLELAGFRCFRAWGGLSDENYGDLLIALISRCGAVWADVSEPNLNVYYEVGAAHALGKPAMLVASTEHSVDVPANIGHDVVFSYDPSDDDYPDVAVYGYALMMSALLVADRDATGRPTRRSVTAALHAAAETLRTTIVPPEAFAAQQEGLDALGEGDALEAARAFRRAVELGLDDAPTQLALGMASVLTDDFVTARQAYLAAAEIADPRLIDETCDVLESIADDLSDSAHEEVIKLIEALRSS
jgi:hypothetical protein